MRAPFALAGGLLVAGIAALAYAASQGQVTVAFVLVVPIIVSTGPWGALAGLLVMGGIVVGFLSMAARISLPRGPREGPHEAAELGPARSRAEEWERRVWLGRPPDLQAEAPRRNAAGGFVLLGPIPIAFGTTKGLALTMLLVALAVLALLLLLPLLLGGRA